MLTEAATTSATVGQDDVLLVLTIVLPVVSILLALLFGGQLADRIAMLTLAVLLGLAVILCGEVVFAGRPLTYIVGNWKPPLGITLRADGLSAAMMLTSAFVMCAVAVFARANFLTPTNTVEARAPFAFWILCVGIAGAMNLICLGGDLFTLYVAIELLTFSAVPLVSLDGRIETLQAALRYLLFAIAGSILYLLGAVLLYASYGALDIVMLSQVVRADFVTLFAAALMTAGLLAKTALFPLHLWLPAAHAGAPAAASAVLSALVVKGSFFLVIRLWYDVMPGIPGLAGTQLLGALGAAALIFGGVMALWQTRLKLLVAYSTVAQIGYLFLALPLSFSSSSGAIERGPALVGGMLQVAAHATAKAGMFMAAGLIYASLGHDRIAGLAGAGRALPLAIAAFTCGSLALIGLPPSGSFIAKSLLLDTPAATVQWWWDWAMSAGSILTSAYMFMVLLRALQPAETTGNPAPVPRYQEATALALSLSSLLLGLAAIFALNVIHDERLPVVTHAVAIAPAALLKSLWPPMLGAALAIGILRAQDRALHARAGIAAAGPLASTKVIDWLDRTLRQWPVGSAAMLFLAIALGAAMITAR